MYKVGDYVRTKYGSGVITAVANNIYRVEVKYYAPNMRLLGCVEVLRGISRIAGWEWLYFKAGDIPYRRIRTEYHWIKKSALHTNEVTAYAA